MGERIQLYLLCRLSLLECRSKGESRSRTKPRVRPRQGSNRLASPRLKRIDSLSCSRNEKANLIGGSANPAVIRAGQTIGYEGREALE
jgi:hypothetical protein